MTDGRLARARTPPIPPALLLFTLAVLAPFAARGEEPTWEELQARGTTLAGIEVQVTDVFDLGKPSENHWVGHAANFVHIETRKVVVARELLFRAGDKVDARLIRETERNLRALEFVREARIVPEGLHDGKAWARVEVQDAWSLKAGLKFSHAGGSTTWRFRLHEVNLLGYGKQLILGYQKDPERTTKELAYVDPQFLGTRWVLEANYQDLSDGSSKLFRLERPYFSLDTPYSLGIKGATQESVLTLYNHGEAVYAYPERHNSADLFGSWAYAIRDRTAFRAGITLRSRDDSYGSQFVYRPGWLPEPDVQDRRFRGVMATWGMVQDRYGTFEDLAGVRRIEDYNMGWDLYAGLGYYAENMGSQENAPFGEAQVKKGWRFGDDTLVLLDSWVQGRKQGDGWHDALTRTELTLYNQSLPRQTLAADLYGVYSTRPDPENWVYLGGPDGMRGYTDHFLAGDRRWVFSVEDRVITDWSLWGLLQVGFVGYADVGAIRRFDTGDWSKTYADVGVGLRFGNLKSAFGRVIQVTVAAPLVREPGMDRYLIVVGNVVRF